MFFDKQCRLKKPDMLVNIALDLFYHYQNFSDLITSLDMQIIGSEYLLKDPVDSINMSVFNHWFSVGPVELWSKGNIYDLDGIKLKIAARPEIERTSRNYQGLLFRFNVDGEENGPYYGIKTPCCTKVGSQWVVDYKKVDFWIKRMLGL